MKAFERIVVLDVETTGFSPAYGDRICEIGLVVVEGKKVVDEFETLVNPNRHIPYPAERVHGIADGDVGNAPRFRDILSSLLPFLKNALLVAHNAGFDHRFVENEIRLAKGDAYGLPTAMACTMHMARERFGYGNANLNAVCARLGVLNRCAHRAKPDAEAEAKVFLKFLGPDGASPSNIENLHRNGTIRFVGNGRMP